MNIALLALTDRGMATALRIGEGLPNSAVRALYIHEKALLSDNSQNQGLWQGRTFRRLSDLVPFLWQEYSVLIFVMATGIVVRQIAPLIDRKDRDPAVLVLDEEGKFVIPLLSGHLGGANAWARQVAQQIKAQAVITTATDGRGLVAPDEYARRFGWKVEPVDHLPAVNRLLLEQGFLKVFTDYPLEPEHAWVTDSHYHFLPAQENDKANVILSAFPSNHIKEDCLYLIPPVLSVGVGCRRGISSSVILERIFWAFGQIGASLKGLSGIYSIDLKSNEMGLVEAAEHLGVPFRTFSADELQEVNQQEKLRRSNFVKETIGVDGVCEAASLLGAHRGRLVLPKIKGQGVTVAISMENSLSSVLDLGMPII
ncbi:cobalt-precorrin 5A hydrolase [Desulfosporosinus sp. SB140]|uniref:cobalt-precorrin 5A hydrolase n=1 Tax=Desulfosporosinus paludis TaxID=3115649 RepID=UPI00388F69C9